MTHLHFLKILLPSLFLAVSPAGSYGQDIDWKRLTPARDGTDWRYFYQAVSELPNLDTASGMAPYRFTVRRRMGKAELKSWDLVFRFGCLIENYNPAQQVKLKYGEDRSLTFEVKSVRLTHPGYRQNEPDDKVGLYEVTVSLSDEEMRFLKSNTANYEKMAASMVFPGKEIILPWDYGLILERAWAGSGKITDPAVIYAAHFTIGKFHHPSLSKK